MVVGDDADLLLLSMASAVPTLSLLMRDSNGGGGKRPKDVVFSVRPLLLAVAGIRSEGGVGCGN